MPKFQEKHSPDNIDRYSVPARSNDPELRAQIDAHTTVLALTDEEIEALIVVILNAGLSFTSTADLRKGIEDERRALRNALRMHDSDTQVLSFDELIPTYLRFNPDTQLGGAVVSSCGEEAGSEATNVLTSGGKWAHLVNHTHEIVLDMGSDETLDAISIPIEAGSNSTHQLTGVNVHVAKLLNKIDDVENIVLTGVDFDTVGGANEHVFGNKRGQFVKLTGFETLNANNNLRVKEILVRVIPKFPKEE